MTKPPSPRPPRPQRLSVNLPDSTVRLLDKLAVRFNVSKSWLIDRLVHSGLEQLERDGAERTLFDNSRK